MPKYKYITIKKKGGGTRKQRVQVLKSGKYKFVKNKRTKTAKRTKTKRSKTKRKKTKRKRYYMSKKKKSYRKKISALSPINKKGVKVVTALVEAAFIAPFFDPGSGRSPYELVKRGDYGTAFRAYKHRMTGEYNNPKYMDLLLWAILLKIASNVSGVKQISILQVS